MFKLIEGLCKYRDMVNILWIVYKGVRGWGV